MIITIPMSSPRSMTTERELHCKDGFGVRQHHPDIVFQKDGESYAIEFELRANLKRPIKISPTIMIITIPMSSPRYCHIFLKTKLV